MDSWTEESSSREESREASDATLLFRSDGAASLRGVLRRRDSEQETESCWDRRDFIDLEEEEEEEERQGKYKGEDGREGEEEVQGKKDKNVDE